MNNNITENLIAESWNHFFKNSRVGAFSQFTIKYPYCSRKCKFCRYPTIIGNNFNEFVGHFDKHLNIYKNIFNKDFKFGNLKIVGGTPNLMKKEEIIYIIKSVYNTFSYHNNIVKSIEVDPNFLTNEIIDIYYNLGFNKIMIGLQSFDKNIMLKMGREISFTFDQFIKYTSYIRNYNIIASVDLLYGLYDSIEENDAKIQEQIDKIIEYVDVIYIYQWSGKPAIELSKLHINREHFYSLPFDRPEYNKIFIGETIKLVSNQVKRKNFYSSTSCRGGESNLGIGNYVFSKIHTIPYAYNYKNGIFNDIDVKMSDSENKMCENFKRISDKEIADRYKEYNFTNGF
jgi:coproporphyrinogen III oxidase-like Fe-S oxidoreductase